MEVTTKTTIKFFENDVKKIIAEYLETKGYHASPEDVDIIVDTMTVNYGTYENDIPHFKHVVVNCKNN